MQQASCKTELSSLDSFSFHRNVNTNEKRKESTMAFTTPRKRYASFDTISSIPGPVIDSFWYIIDNQLKGVFPMQSILNFKLIDSDGQLSVQVTQDNDPLSITVDFDYPFNSEWPRIFHAVDNMGRETIVTSREL